MASKAAAIGTMILDARAAPPVDSIVFGPFVSPLRARIGVNCRRGGRPSVVAFVLGYDVLDGDPGTEAHLSDVRDSPRSRAFRAHPAAR